MDLGTERDVVTMVDGNVNRQAERAFTTVKTHPVPDQAEAYNLTRDPLELHNLDHSPRHAVRAGSAS